MSQLRQRLERASSIVRVSCQVDFTHDFRVAATSKHWKGEGSVDEKESEPAEGPPTETGQGSVKVTGPGRSGKGSSLRH